jgi:hypothetical protein
MENVLRLTFLWNSKYFSKLFLVARYLSVSSLADLYQAADTNFFSLLYNRTHVSLYPKHSEMFIFCLITALLKPYIFS